MILFIYPSLPTSFKGVYFWVFCNHRIRPGQYFGIFGNHRIDFGFAGNPDKSRKSIIFFIYTSLQASFKVCILEYLVTTGLALDLLQIQTNTRNQLHILFIQTCRRLFTVRILEYVVTTGLALDLLEVLEFAGNSWYYIFIQACRRLFTVRIL